MLPCTYLAALCCAVVYCAITITSFDLLSSLVPEAISGLECCQSVELQDSENDGWQKQGPVQSGVPRHWGSVRCGCIEGVLATAILAGQHPDVWDAAGLLLREHHKYDIFRLDRT